MGQVLSLQSSLFLCIFIGLLIQQSGQLHDDNNNDIKMMVGVDHSYASALTVIPSVSAR